MTQFCRNFTVLSLLFLLTAAAFAQTDARLRLAQSYERAGNYEPALEIYLDFYQKGNRGYGIIRGIQKCYLNLHRYPELIHFLQNLTQRFSSNLSYKIELGRAYYLNQQKDEALKQWYKTIAEQPSNGSAYRFAGRVMTELRLLDEAADLYLKAIQTIKNQETLYRDIANIRRAQLDYGRAAKNLLLWYLSDRKQKGYIQSQLTAMAKDNEAAKKILLAIQNSADANPGDKGILEFEALLHIRLKQYAQALTIYKKLKNINLLLQFARETVLEKAFPFAIDAYRLALVPNQKRHRINDIKYYLAKTYYAQAIWLARQKKNDRAQNAFKQAETILSELTNQKEDFRTRQRSLELNGDMQQRFLHDPQKALSFYRQALTTVQGNSANDRIRLKVAEIFLRRNDLTKALGQYKLVTSRQYSAEAFFRRAEIACFQGRFTFALKQFTRLQGKLSVSDTLFNNVLKQRQFIEQYRSDSLSLTRFAAACLLERQQRLPSAATAFERIFKIGGSLAPQAGLRAAGIFKRLQNPEKSAAILVQLLEQFPEGEQTDRALFLLAMVKEEQNQLREALVLYMRIITNFPDSFQIDTARENARRLQNRIGATNQ